MIQFAKHQEEFGFSEELEEEEPEEEQKAGSPGLSSKTAVGNAGEHLVASYLSGWGYEAHVINAEGLDILVPRPDTPPYLLRIQVKTNSKPYRCNFKGKEYWRWRFIAKKCTGGVGIALTRRDADIIACVALAKRRIYFDVVGEWTSMVFLPNAFDNLPDNFEQKGFEGVLKRLDREIVMSNGRVLRRDVGEVIKGEPKSSGTFLEKPPEPLTDEANYYV